MITKKETVRITLPQKREGISGDQASSYALQVIGTHFTKTFIESLGNSKLKGFLDNAESCLNKLSEWNSIKLWMFLCSVLIIIPITAVIVVSTRHYLDTYSMVGIFLSILVGLLYFPNKRALSSRPGDTTKMVAKAWRPWRKRVIAAKIIEGLAFEIQWHSQHDSDGSRLLWEIDDFDFGGEELQKRLESTLDTLAQKTAADFKAAERDGVKGDRKRLRNQFGAIDKIGQQLGFERLDWKKMLNS